MQKYILIGDSGHANVIQDCINSNGDRVIARLDDKHEEQFKEDDLIKGPISIVYELLEQDTKVILAIGHNLLRKKIVERLNLNHHVYGIVKHKQTIISDSVKIENGTVIMPGAVINANSIIGRHVIANSNSTVEHDCHISDFVHISPGVTITGNVRVAMGTHIGAATTIIPGKEVGSWCVIGAGSTVISTIENSVTAVGSPAKVIKKEGLLK